jgi:DNA-binding transcriptional ArsR family regulator
VLSSPERYERVGDLFRILASPARLAIDLLSKEECSVYQLVEATGLSQPNVSQHLRILREAGLVRHKRRGRQIVYTLRDDHVADIITDAVAHSREELS